MVNKFKTLFDTISAVWDLIPGYAKVFLYSTTSALVGLYLADKQINAKVIIAIVATNLGIYSVPKQVRKMI